MNNKQRKRVVAVLAGLVLLSTLGWLQAGGFLNVSRTGIPYRWMPGAPILYHPDRGMLGQLTNQQALDLVASNFAHWSRDSISTTSLSLTNAGALPIDVVTAEDYARFDATRDSINPVIFDATGELFEALGFGSGVLGFSQIDFGDQTSPFFLQEGKVVLNGRFLDGDPSNGETTVENFARTVTHEFGHFLNLAHTQINGHYYLSNPDQKDPGFIKYGAPPPASIAVMFPVNLSGIGASRTPLKDDIQAVSTLYPASGFPGSHGTIEGRVFLPDGTTQFQGVNVIVRNVNDPFFDAVSGVTGDLYRPTFRWPEGTVADANLRGFYRVNALTLGEAYTVEATSVQSRFVRGSIVGPVDPPAVLASPEEFWNGEGESAGVDDNPLDFEPVTVNGTVSDIDIILNEPPFTLTLDKFDEDDVGFILSVQSLVSRFDTPNGDNDYAAVRLEIPASVVAPYTVPRASFYNNDDRTVWPRILLTHASADGQPDLASPLAEVNNFSGPALGFAVVPFDVVVDTTADLFLVIQFPPGEAISAPGSLGGPGIGGEAELGIGLQQYVAGNLFSTDGITFEENLTTFAANWAMRVDIVPAATRGDEFEPNDDAASATPIAYGETHKASLDPGGDVDYYTFSGSAGDTVRARIRAQALNSSLDATLFLVNGAGDTLVTNDDRATDSVDPVAQAVLPASGDYQVVVASTDGAGPEFFYDLFVDKFSPPLEPDNTVAQATAIDTGRARVAALDFPGDIDFFAFEGKADELATVQLALDGSVLDPVLTLFAPDGTTILTVVENNRLQFKLPSDGTFFFSVADLNGGGGADFFYSVVVFVSPAILLPPVQLTAQGFKDRVRLEWGPPVLNEIEPNGDRDNMQKLPGPSPVVLQGSAEQSDQGEFSIAFSDGSRDNFEDLFLVEINSPGLNIKLTDLQSDLDLYLIDEQFTEFLARSDEFENVDEEINEPALAPGTYVIAVTIYDFATPSESPYTLTVTGDIPTNGPTLQSYNVYRSESTGAFASGQVVANVPVGTTVFDDTDLLPNTFFYQVTALYDFGESPPSNEVSAVVTSVADAPEALPKDYALEQNYPNPFNPSTLIGYAIPAFHAGRTVKLEVYNMLGQKVRTLVNKPEAAGVYRVEWDGKDEAGKPVTSGLYVYRLKAGSFVKVKKMLFIK